MGNSHCEGERLLILFIFSKLLLSVQNSYERFESLFSYKISNKLCLSKNLISLRFLLDEATPMHEGISQLKSFLQRKQTKKVLSKSFVMLVHFLKYHKNDFLTL